MKKGDVVKVICLRLRKYSVFKANAVYIARHHSKNCYSINLEENNLPKPNDRYRRRNMLVLKSNFTEVYDNKEWM